MGIGRFWKKLTGKAQEEQARKDAEFARNAALTEMGPEAMTRLMQAFFRQNQQVANPMMQSAIAGLQGAAGKSGRTDMGLYHQLKAGIPGQFAQSMLEGAQNKAYSAAEHRSDIFQNMKLPTVGSPVNKMANMAIQYYTGGRVKGFTTNA